MKLNNTYYILRHGESVANVKEIHSCWPEKFFSPLTLKGRKETKSAAEKLKSKRTCPEFSRRIDFIFSSDILRTKQTAEIVGKILKIKPKYDKRLREVNIGIFNAKPLSEFRKLFPLGNINKRFKSKPLKGETYIEVRDRMLDFLKSTDKKYRDKNILIISHQAPLALLETEVKGKDFKKFWLSKEKRIKTGELRQLLTE